MNKTILAGVTALLLTACTSGENATQTTPVNSKTTAPATTTPTPVTTAAPTTAAATATTATAAPTIAPPTAPPASEPAPQQIAEAEVLRRLDAFWVDVEGCFAAPDTCDSDAIMNEFTNGDGPVVEWFYSWADSMKQEQQMIINQDDSEVTLREIIFREDGRVATSQCKIDRGAQVQLTTNGTEVVDDGTGFGRYDFVWSKEDNAWIIVESALYNMVQPEDGGCVG